MPRASYDLCTKVTPECPVAATTYGYYPNLAGNSFYVAFFGLCLLVQLFIGIKQRTWTYMLALGVGTFGEMVGYIGRVWMHSNPWNTPAFEVSCRTSPLRTVIHCDHLDANMLLGSRPVFYCSRSLPYSQTSGQLLWTGALTVETTPVSMGVRRG